jgi:hypothetical protein
MFCRSREFGDRRISFAAEPVGVRTQWREGQSFSPKIWNVADLAAFALGGGLELVLFDQGVGQYRSVRTRILR